MAGIALAAQVGAGFTAQLGAMRISEEVDALEVMGINSVVYLVATRVWAALITMIPLYLAALFSSYLATELIVTKFFGLSTGTYQHYFQLFLPPIDIFYSFLKAITFADPRRAHPLLLRLQRPGRAGRGRRGGRPGHPPLDHHDRARQPAAVAGPLRRHQRHGEVGRMSRLAPHRSSPCWPSWSSRAPGWCSCAGPTATSRAATR